MLTEKDLKRIEQIICYKFNNQGLLTNLFNQEVIVNHEARANGLNIFEWFLKTKVDFMHNYDSIKKYHYQYEDIKEMFEDDNASNFYSSLKKIGLNEYLHFNESTNPQKIYDFVFLLINAISVDCNNNKQHIIKAINKITLYDYVIYYPGFEYKQLDFRFALDSYQCKHITMEIYCPKFLAYNHQEAIATFDYLAHYFIDLKNKVADDNDQLKSIWNDNKFNDQLLIKLDSVTKRNKLYYGFLCLHDEYYWYCLVFVSKFNLAFFAKGQSKEEAKLLAVTAFIKHYTNCNDDEKYLIEDGKAIDLNTLFFVLLANKIDLHYSNETKLHDFNWKSANCNQLISQLDAANIYSLTVIQKDWGKSTAVIFVAGAIQAFGSLTWSNPSAVKYACKQLIKYYLHQ